MIIASVKLIEEKIHNHMNISLSEAYEGTNWKHCLTLDFSTLLDLIGKELALNKVQTFITDLINHMGEKYTIKQDGRDSRYFGNHTNVSIIFERSDNTINNEDTLEDFRKAFAKAMELSNSRDKHTNAVLFDSVDSVIAKVLEPYNITIDGQEASGKLRSELYKAIQPFLDQNKGRAA